MRNLVDERIEITNWQTIGEYGKGVTVGKNFAFLQPEKVDILNLFGIFGVRPQIISLLGKEEVDLGGMAKIKGTQLPETGIPSISASSMLYKEGDTAHLQIIYIGKVNQEVVLEIRIGSQKASEIPVMLNEYGMAEYKIAKLSQGTYTANIKGTSASTFFAVASHELAAFDAQLIKQELRKEDVLNFVVQFQTHGVPFAGQVIGQLQSNGENVGNPITITSDKNGTAEGEIKLQGKGELTINFQVSTDSGKTASVLVKGAKEEARKVFEINRLGEIVEISTMKLANSYQVKGINWRNTGKFNETPLQVERAVTKDLVVTAKENCKVVKIVAVDLTTKEVREYDYDRISIKKGVKIAIRISKPAIAIYLATILEDGKCWEGETTILYPQELALEIILPEKVEPGEEVEIKFITNAQNKTPVAVVVRDSRLTTIDPGTGLAISLKSQIESFAGVGKIGYVEKVLSKIVPQYSEYVVEEMSFRDNIMRGTMGDDDIPHIRSMSSVPLLGSAIKDMCFVGSAGAKSLKSLEVKTAVAVAVAEPELEIDFSQLPVLRQTDKAPEVIFTGKIWLENGQGSFKISIPDAPANYVIETIAVGKDFDWQSVSMSFLAVKDLTGELDLPEFVHLGDQAEGKLTITCQSRQFKVWICQDSGVVEMRRSDNRVIGAGVVFEDQQVEIFFPVQPGKIRVTIEDVRTGKIDIVEKTVHEPGKLNYKVQLTQLLQPGRVITLDDFPGATEIRVQPGLKRSTNRLNVGIMDYPHGCCEQTATGILAAVSMYLGGSNGNQDKAEEYILAGIKREESMWLPKRGFKMYPERGDTVDTHYGPQAALRLLSLKDLENSSDDLSPALAKAVKQGLEMAFDACKAYKLKIVPIIIKSCQDAYRVMSSNTQAKSSALFFAKSQLQDNEDGIYVKSKNGRVDSRAETAYAAATLLLAGGQSEISLAIQAVNWLTSQTQQDGRYYSTIDSVAGIVIMSAVQKADLVVGSGKIRINGQEMNSQQAISFNDEITKIEVIEGIVIVEIHCQRQENWNNLPNNISQKVEYSLQKDGNVVNLKVILEKYEPGLLLHYQLPPCLRRNLFGGKVSRETIDFEGKTEINVSLGINGKVSGQSWELMVRNMFKEEEVWNPGVQKLAL